MKKIVIFLCVIIFFSIASNSVMASTSRLHVDGRNLKDDAGNIVTMRGVNVGDDFWTKTGQGYWSAFGGWSDQAVADNLDAMLSWGINAIRLTTTMEKWLNGNDTYDGAVHSRPNYINNMKTIVSLANDRGIYVIFCAWGVTNERLANGTENQGMPFPPYTENTNLIPNINGFVSYWGNVSQEMSIYPNVLFDLYNEPVNDGISSDATARSAWFIAAQQAINAIRARTNNTILVQLGYSMSEDTSYPPPGNQYEGSFYWVEDYPLAGTNLLYSHHKYKGEGGPHTYDEVKEQFELDRIRYVLENQSKPVVIGEIGANVWWDSPSYPPEDILNQYEGFENSLRLMNEWGVSYLAWWWRGYGQYNLFDGVMSTWENGPNHVGQLLIDGISPSVSGTITNSSGVPIQANVTILVHNSGTIVSSNQTNSSGCYTARASPGIYDIQFDSPNFSIKVINQSLFYRTSDLIREVSYNASRLKIVSDIDSNRTFEFASMIEPNAVRLNSTVLTRVSTISQLRNGAWYFDSAGKKLHIIANSETKALCPFSCCIGDSEYFDGGCDSNSYCSSHTCVSRTACPFECCSAETTYVDKICTGSKGCYNRSCMFFADGFESGDVSGWNPYFWSGNISVQTTFKHSGNYSMNVSNYADQAWGVQTVYKEINASSMRVKLYFLLDRLPPQGKRTGSIVTMVNYSGTGMGDHIARVTIDNDSGTYAIHTPWNSSSMPLQANRWYSLEYYVRVGSSGEESVYIDGHEIIRTYPNTAGSGNITRVFVGSNTGWSGGADWPFNMYVDDVEIDDAP